MEAGSDAVEEVTAALLVDVKVLQGWALALSQGDASKVRWEIEGLLKSAGHETRDQAG